MGLQRARHDLATQEQQCWYHSVIRSGVQLLAPQKPLKSPSWWKGKFGLLWMPAIRGEGRVDTCPQTDSSPPHWQVRWQELLQTEGRGYLWKQHSQLWQSSCNCLSVVWPASPWLFQAQLIFSSGASWFPFLWGSSQSRGNLCHDYSLVIIQLTSPPVEGFNICKTAHRMQLRILPTALKRS